jgi:hypothetical protein
MACCSCLRFFHISIPPTSREQLPDSLTPPYHWCSFTHYRLTRNGPHGRKGWFSWMHENRWTNRQPNRAQAANLGTIAWRQRLCRADTPQARRGPRQRRGGEPRVAFTSA